MRAATGPPRGDAFPATGSAVSSTQLSLGKSKSSTQFGVIAASGQLKSSTANSVINRSASSQALQFLPRLVPEHVRNDFFKHSEATNGALGKRNVKQVLTQFKFRKYIEKPENRSVMTEHLANICQYANANCSSWKLDPGKIDICQIKSWIIEPCTKDTYSAFAEHLLDGDLPPSWFVCHRWKEPFADVVKSVQHHSSMRCLQQTVGYWIAAFALKQRNVEAGLSLDPERSGFTRALHAARFKTLLILNTSSADEPVAMAFKRTWCAFENAICLDQASVPLDVAVCHNDQVEFIMRGCTVAEKNANTYDAGQGIVRKLRRERTFPAEIVNACISFDITNCQASSPKDFGHIMNHIIGADLEGPVSDDDSLYEGFNKRLRSLYAIIFWQWALSMDRPTEETGRRKYFVFLKNMGYAIRGDESRVSLSTSLAGCNLGDSEAWDHVLDSLPPNLVSLNLDLQDNGLTDDNFQSLAKRLPQTIETLCIDMSGCSQVSDNGLMIFGKGMSNTIKKLSLGVARTKVSEGVNGVLKHSLALFRQWARARPSEQEDIVAAFRKQQARLNMKARDPDQDDEERKAALQRMLDMPRRRVTADVRTRCQTTIKDIDAAMAKRDQRFRK